MNPEVKTKWLAELRSGKYTQAHERLKGEKENSFCCLGVLCELFREEYPDYSWSPSGSFLNANGEPEGNTYPCAEVIEWSGIPMRNPRVKIRPLPDCSEAAINLGNLNDGSNGCPQFSFAKIADLIEEQL